MSPALLSERIGPILRLELNRPRELNALNVALVEGLKEAASAASADPTVRVVIVTGAGRAFCAGADLKQVRDAAASPDRMRAILLSWRQAFGLLESIPQPVIAAVNGAALAGGLELALACDVIVASRSAALGDVHARYGLLPGGGGSLRLPRAVGARTARWLMYTGETLSADEAMRIGLVQAVYDDDVFEERVLEAARRIARGSRAGLSAMKRLSSEAPSDEALDSELAAVLEVLAGPDATEGIAAFAERREPRFHDDEEDGWRD